MKDLISLVMCGITLSLIHICINIRMISTSEFKISVLINEEDSEKAVKAIHEEFFNA